MRRKGRFLKWILVVTLIFSMMPTKAFAASYPIVTSTLESSQTIPEGEVGLLRLMILPEYHNEKYNVELYNSKGQLIASAGSSYYNSDGTFVKYVNISIDTDKLDMEVGTYTAKYWMSFYSLYSWHDAPNVYSHHFEVIKNTCNGSHDLIVEKVVTAGTCKEEGTVKVNCSKCEYTGYKKELGEHTYGKWTNYNSSQHKRTCSTCEAIETNSHSWNIGTVTKQPTCSTTGIKTYTCTVCGGTKTETIANTNNHTYSEWIKLNDATHQRSCTLCSKTETANHDWNAGTVTKQPTCADNGTKTYICITCGGTKTESLSKTNDHIYGDCSKVNDATHRHVCTICAKTETLPHTWDKGTIRVMPTVDTTGLRLRTCTDCGATKEEVIPACIIGDIDSSDGITDADAEYLLMHTFFPEDYPVNQECDFNGDGKVNDADAEYLLMYTFFPEDYPLN